MKPAIVVVDSDSFALGKIRAELERRYANDYRLVFEAAPDAALRALAGMERVAVVLAAQWMPGMEGAGLLNRVKELHPRTKRALLIEWGQWGHEPTAAAIRSAMSTGCIDYYVLKPTRSPDELFHRGLSEFLHEWSRANEVEAFEVTVCAPSSSPRGYELRNLLTRNGVPHTFVASDSPQGAEVLDAAGVPGTTEPVVTLLGGRVLVDPSDAELAEAYGVTTTLATERDFDVAIVGAGPAGLAAAVYGSSEGLETIVVERKHIGGQAGSSSMIRNYLGFSRGVAGADLAQRAYQQAWVFGTRFLLMREVQTLVCGERMHELITADGTHIRARAVVLATGVNYRSLDVPSLETLVGRGVFYGASPAEAPQFEGKRAFVVGAGNSAGQAAIHLAKWAKEVTIVCRGESLAKSMSKYLIDEIGAASNIDVCVRTRVVDGRGDFSLEAITLADDAEGSTRTVPADALFLLIGASPRTEGLPASIARDKHGFVITGAQLSHDGLLGDFPIARPPYSLETSTPGVFAVGDVRAGSMKRVASAVGEGSAVVKEIHTYFEFFEKWQRTRRVTSG